jgi:uncharacterized delta-60 repeat protein
VLTDFADGGDFLYSLAVNPDGRMIAVGGARQNGDFVGVILEYRSNGQLDHTFGSKGRVFNDDIASAQQAIVQPDGKIIVAGSGQGGAGDPAFALVRYNPDGSLDPSFGDRGEVFDSFAGPVDGTSSLAIQSDGKILIGGETVVSIVVGNVATINGDFAIARYNPDGTPDMTFGTAGKVTTDFLGQFDRIVNILIQPDGKIIAGGTAGKPGGPAAGSYFALARYNLDGTLDSTFGQSGKLTLSFGNIDDALYCVALQPDGKIVEGGNAILPGESVMALARFNPDGGLDTSFGDGGKVMTRDGNCGQIMAIYFQPDGKILGSGLACDSAVDGITFLTARYNKDGTLDMVFGSNGISTGKFFGTRAVPFSVVFQPDGKVLAGGSLISSAPQFAIARYKTGSSQ